MESDVKNNPKRKGQLLRKAVREPKLSLRSIPARAEENRNEPPKVKETLKETNPKKGQRSTGT